MKIVISESGRASNPFLEHISLIQGDVTTQSVDAIAMVIPQRLEFKGSINQSIMHASGHDLESFIKDNIYKPRIGDAYALPAFGLPAKHILLGIMPYYRTDFDREDGHLSGTVRRIMELARCMLLTSIAFPPVASGKRGFAKPKAARLISQGITERMQETFEDVRIVCQEEAMLEKFDQKLRSFGWEGES